LYVSVGIGTQPNLNARDYEQLIENLPVVPLEANIARRAGVIAGVHRASDAKPALGLADAVVAATGLVFNEAVITSDTSDFDAVDGLQVATWK
jgi:predicted nucleic acid-binding protein